jgi:hypothetical protein
MRNPVDCRSRMQLLLPFYNPIAAGLDVELTYRQGPIRRRQDNSGRYQGARRCDKREA